MADKIKVRVALEDVKKGDMVALMTFTNLFIKASEVTAADKKSITIEGRKGDLVFSRETGLQTSETKSGNPGYGNKICLVEDIPANNNLERVQGILAEDDIEFEGFKKAKKAKKEEPVEEEPADEQPKKKKKKAEPEPEEEPEEEEKPKKKKKAKKDEDED